MRERKPSDSPSGYDRDVFRLRPHHGLTVPMIQQAQAAKLNQLSDMSVRLGGDALPLGDPRDIAGTVEAAARTLRMSVVSGGEAHMLADALGAQVLALRLALARSESEQPHSGGEAA